MTAEGKIPDVVEVREEVEKPGSPAHHLEVTTSSSTNIISPVKESSDMAVFAGPGDSAQGSSRSRSVSEQSDDSITEELRHFKPIKAAPKTPPKRLPDGRFVEPKLIYTRPCNLKRIASPEKVIGCPVLWKKIKMVHFDRLSHGSVSRGTETDASMFSVLSEKNPLESNVPVAQETNTKSKPTHFVGTKKRPTNSTVGKANTSKEENIRVTPKNQKTTTTKKRKNDQSDNIKPMSVKCSTSVLVESEYFVDQQTIIQRLKQEESDRQVAVKLQKKLDAERVYDKPKLDVREPYMLRRKRVAPVSFTATSGRKYV